MWLKKEGDQIDKVRAMVRQEPTDSTGYKRNPFHILLLQHHPT
jgi:hypothetical protein